MLKKFLFILLYLSINLIYSQDKFTLSGYVLDENSNESIIGANIIIQDSYFGAAADVDGYYYINNILLALQNL